MVILLGGIITTLATASQGDCEPVLNVHYDKKQDRLTIQGENASLKKVLAVIAFQSGLEVSMAPGAEKKITISMEGYPLEEGLKHMARQLNLSQAMYYRKASGEKEPSLVGIKVVPTGTSFDTAMPVENLKQ